MQSGFSVDSCEPTDHQLEKLKLTSSELAHPPKQVFFDETKWNCNPGCDLRDF